MSEQLKRPGTKRGRGDRCPPPNPPPRTLLIRDEHQPCSALQVLRMVSTSKKTNYAEVKGARVRWSRSGDAAGGAAEGHGGPITA